MTKVRSVMSELRRGADPSRLPGMARYGIAVDRALGVSIPDLRRLARRTGRDHQLALSLWDTEVHEARILAGMVDDPLRVTKAQMERWARDFDSWDLCDQVCSNLFDGTPFAFEKAAAWSTRRPEFVKRAAFATVAAAAVHRKDVDDDRFVTFLPVIEAQATDERNYVKKAVNWALRQIGKRSPDLHREAVACAERIRCLDSRTARWIAADALRELSSAAVIARLGLAGT
ncbi:MAG TPA: DNA alkylation repair protein [Actinomycetota bacterium]